MGRKRREDVWYQAFGGRIRAAMEGARLRQIDLAERMGVSDGAVSRWLNGTAPDPAELARLAVVLGVSADYLLGLTSPKTRPEPPPLPARIDKRAVGRAIKRLRAVAEVADELADLLPEEDE